MVLWRVRYKLSLRDLPAMCLERGVVFTHEAVRDWEALRAPLLSERLRKHRRGRIGSSWYVDESAPRTHPAIEGVRCCTGDEGGPLGVGVQAQTPNRLKLQRSRAVVVSVEEKAGP